MKKRKSKVVYIPEILSFLCKEMLAVTVFYGPEIVVICVSIVRRFRRRNVFFVARKVDFGGNICRPRSPARLEPPRPALLVIIKGSIPLVLGAAARV